MGLGKCNGPDGGPKRLDGRPGARRDWSRLKPENDAMPERVPEEHRGDVWPAATPAGDRALYGHVAVAPDAPVEARSRRTFTLTYTCGRFGIDGGGGLKFVFRFSTDWGLLQADDPGAGNYVSATNSRGLPLRVTYDPGGHTRPWYQALHVLMPHGHLDEGDTIAVALGDTSGGSPGVTVQSCAERDFRFTTLVDVAATGLYAPVAESPVVPVVAGDVDRWHAVLPSLRRPGEPFRFGLRAEDRWGNPTPRASEDLILRPSLPVRGLPERFAYGRGIEAHAFDGLVVEEEGVLRIEVRDDEGARLARSSPMIVRRGDVAGWWADLHGQSGESVGINTARHYFQFSRDTAFLDAGSHQANDFQVNNAFWKHLNALTAAFDEDDRFVAYPGYEWSANTPLGGDRNVYFREEGQRIHRSSHALLPDRSDIDTDAHDAPALFAALKGKDAVVFAHVGGRWADLTRGHDGRLETAVEIHSAWGTFEWLMADAFRLGLRMGVVANSDGHKGRPGASHPGASQFAAYGGLTCLLAPELTRDALFYCLRRRRHFATTGSRMHLDVAVGCEEGLTVWSRDPAVYGDAEAEAAETADMGAIVTCAGPAARLSFAVEAASPVEKVEVRNGAETVEVLRPYGPGDLGPRLLVRMSGAERRGKGALCRWRGEAVLDGAAIAGFRPVCAWNPELPCERMDAHRVAFEARTAGNMTGFDLELEEIGAGRITVDTGHGTVAADLSGIGWADRVTPLGGLDRRLRIARAPSPNPYLAFSGSASVPLGAGRDNPLWICVTTEDGHQAWSSPIYAIAS